MRANKRSICGRAGTAFSRLCAVAARQVASPRALIGVDELPEIYMYIGGGILGTILLIALIVFVLNGV
jgi:hypothetical protein